MDDPVAVALEGVARAARAVGRAPRWARPRDRLGLRGKVPGKHHLVAIFSIVIAVGCGSS